MNKIERWTKLRIENSTNRKKKKKKLKIQIDRTENWTKLKMDKLFKNWTKLNMDRIGNLTKLS